MRERPVTAEGRDALDPLPLLAGAHPREGLTERLLAPALRPAGFTWWALFALSGAGTALYVFAIVYTFAIGIGAWGNNIPNAWAFAIINFVWWIGFGHAGTLISAILVLFQQKWRASINRLAETMTLCAVAQAGLFPVLHLGRPQYAFWIFPYPSVLAVWPQFRSALTWDAGAVGTYMLVSILFWYVGMIPDLAAARDRAATPRRRLAYAVLCLGWRSSARAWSHWRTGYLVLAALASALVVSVESIVSMDFATAQLPGWHSTIFPPYYVASAMFGGFALLVVILVGVREAYRLQAVITTKHLDLVNRMVLLFSWFVAYGYLQENLMAWYGGDRYELGTFAALWTGHYAGWWWATVATTVLAPQLMWSARLRRSRLASLGVGAAVIAGVWLEQLTHVIPPLSHGHIPAMWRPYAPTWVDLSILVGSISFFVFLYVVLAKLLPLLPASDVKHLQEELAEAEEDRRARLAGPPRLGGG